MVNLDTKARVKIFWELWHPWKTAVLQQLDRSGKSKKKIGLCCRPGTSHLIITIEKQAAVALHQSK